MVKKTRRTKKTVRKPAKKNAALRNLVREGQTFMASVDRRMRRLYKGGRIVARGMTRRSQARKNVHVVHAVPSPPVKKAVRKRELSESDESSSQQMAVMEQDPKPKSGTKKPIPPHPKPAKQPKTRNNLGKATKLKSTQNNEAMIPAYGFIDVCFCVDATSSMWGEIDEVKRVIQCIIHNIQTKVRTEGLTLRFAVVTYRDHPPQDHTYVTKFNDFTDNFETIEYVKNLTASGGGDQPEAVHDGLMVSAKDLNWATVPGTPVLRYIFHVADAPPHGKQFDTHQSQTGCFCGLQTDDVIRQINIKQIHYRLIKVRKNPRVDKMQRIFKQKIADFDSTQIQQAKQMNVKVSDMIIHEVLPDFA